MTIDVNTLIGKKFGKLTITSFSHREKGRSFFMICRCDCGVVKPVRWNSIQSGISTSCGCIRNEQIRKYPMSRKVNLEGRRSHSLTYIGEAESIRTCRRIICRCDCGRTVTLYAGVFTSGIQKTCGRNHFKPHIIDT